MKESPISIFIINFNIKFAINELAQTDRQQNGPIRFLSYFEVRQPKIRTELIRIDNKCTTYLLRCKFIFLHVSDNCVLLIFISIFVIFILCYKITFFFCQIKA